MAFDCPVTGGESGAIAGTLTAIVGATENDIAPVRDILSTFAATICCFDGAGKGRAAKLANRVAGRLHGRHGRCVGICRAERP